MTSDVDYSMHEVDGPSEISRHTPLSDKHNHRKGRAPKRKQRRGRKTGGAGAKRPVAGARDTDIPDSDQAAQISSDDHEVDYYA